MGELVISLLVSTIRPKQMVTVDPNPCGIVCVCGGAALLCLNTTATDVAKALLLRNALVQFPL